MKALTLLAIALAELLSHGALAQAAGVPSLINYQGRLTDDQGGPLASGGYRLAFRLWADATSTASSNLVWGREFDVTVIGGAFNVILSDDGQPAEVGLTAELSAAFSAPSRFLGLSILRTPAGTIPAAQRMEILPRQQLLSMPYSIVAEHLAQAAADLLVPPGTINAFGGATVPRGWVLCDGRAVSSKQFPRLFIAIARAWGDGSNDADQETDFNLPDLRGMFLRGVNGGRADSFADPDTTNRVAAASGGYTADAVGSVQAHAFQKHTHEYLDRYYVNPCCLWVPGPGGGGAENLRPGYRETTGATSEAGSAIETRPNNAYVHFIIKH